MTPVMKVFESDNGIEQLTQYMIRRSIQAKERWEQSDDEERKRIIKEVEGKKGEWERKWM